jgi:quercetin dioxygenase-like cupin family protein
MSWPPAPVPAAAAWVRTMDIRYIDQTLSGFAEVCLFHVTFEPGVERGRHRHPNASEFLAVLSGRGAWGFLDQEHEVRPGSVEMVPAGMPHWLRNTGDEPLVIVDGYLGAGSLAAAGSESLGPLTDAMRQVRPPRPGPGPR